MERQAPVFDSPAKTKDIIHTLTENLKSELVRSAALFSSYKKILNFKLIIVKNTVAVTEFPKKVTNDKAPCPSAYKAKACRPKKEPQVISI